jgi:hypothetical protein
MPVRKPTKRPLRKKADPLVGKPLTNSDKCEIQEIEALYGAEFEPETLEDFKTLRQLAESRWRMRRADEMEVELFSSNMPEDERDPDLALAKAFMKDANGERVLSKILTYRERAETSYYRALKLLQARKRRLKTRSPQAAAEPAEAPAQAPQPPQLLLIRGKNQGGASTGARRPLRLLHGSKRPPHDS